ncbi:ribokinase [Corynebacterium hylobatis]|uniref:Ribokinase n=1 Tax=Corynebacterium hylobatis TaxID=1859290 RepID=A0A430I1M4_9CORY|nr:ribokinase [Corynebacterium hylobatis]RSZ66045.1 ribokinase [Corynebacterium hylobatis]
MTAIAVVGSINADLTTHVHRHPSPGETLLGSGGDISAGGKGANQAVAAAQLGADVTMIGAVGSDSMAAAALEHLRTSGADTSAITTVAGPTGLAVITVAEDGENTIIVVPGANASVDGTYVDTHAQTVAEAGILLLQGEIPADGFDRAVDLAKGRVVVNLAPVVPVGIKQLLRSDPLLVNEHEGALVLDLLGVPFAESDPATLVSALLAQGFVSVVMTLGAAGAIVGDTEGLTDIPTPQITAVDTTGSGDAFAGALVAKLAAGATLIEAAEFAARVGAFAATRPGAQASYPTLADTLPAVHN